MYTLAFLVPGHTAAGEKKLGVSGEATRALSLQHLRAGKSYLTASVVTASGGGFDRDDVTTLWD